MSICSPRCRFRWLVSALAMLAALVVGSFSRAGDWPGWRGPTGVGYTDAKDLPLTWNAKTGENIAWKAPLKDLTGHSCPIGWGDRVFLTAAAKQTREQETAKEIPQHFLLCFDAKDGTERWRTTIEPGKELAGYTIYASPTPATDGKAVYCWFGSGVIAAVDWDGKVLWRHERPGPFKLNPGLCSSPVLYGHTVLLLCDQGGGGWLQALDKQTGDVMWERKREKLSYCNTTPVLATVNGKPQLIIQGSSLLQGLDPASGEPLWWCKAKGFGASPAIGSGLVFSDSGNGESGLVVDPGGEGDVTGTRVKWQVARIPSQYGSAVTPGSTSTAPATGG